MILDDTCQDGRTRKLSARTLWHRWPQDVCRQDVALPLMVFLEVPWMEPGHLKGLWKGHLKADWLCYAGFYCTWSCCACFVHDLTEAFKQAHSYTALMCSEATCLSSCCIIDQRFSRESIVKQLLNVSVSMADPLSSGVSLPRTPKEWCFARRWFQQASDEGFLEGVWSAEWYVCWGLQRPDTRHCYLAAARSPRMTTGSNRKTA